MRGSGRGGAGHGSGTRQIPKTECSVSCKKKTSTQRPTQGCLSVAVAPTRMLPHPHCHHHHHHHNYYFFPRDETLNDLLNACYSSLYIESDWRSSDATFKYYCCCCSSSYSCHAWWFLGFSHSQMHVQHIFSLKLWFYKEKMTCLSLLWRWLSLLPSSIFFSHINLSFVSLCCGSRWPPHVHFSTSKCLPLGRSCRRPPIVYIL